ncbi:hypothetical protein F4680DRAFT_245288 [Xylaria scruposa]|nr:hypothetical protein F4680DRAFT_245288 [Xylaria scruposa]
MDHQESPSPRQRHRVPHHRRRRRHHDYNSAAQTANDKPALTLGRLNREYHALDSQNVVESWLGQLTAPVPTSWLVSSEAQNQLIHRRKRQHSQDRHIFPCGQNPGRVDPLWRPQHIPPAQGSLPPRFPLPTHRNTKTKQYKQNSADSSLISDLAPHQELQEIGYVKTNSEHDESSSHNPLDDAEVDTADASSPMSHKSIALVFKKRRRHKTKADKYDTKKSEDRKRSKEGEHRPRRSKSNRRRPIVTGKNVMKNFTSEAVLNDRITVQANLKPGLFSNKRVPKEQLITDLSFSEMPFPTHQERDVPQQKGLSSSRLSERRRESRELEQISSFFQPARANETSRKGRQAELTCRKEANNKRSHRRDKTTSGFYQDSFATPSSPTPPETHRQRSSISWEKSHPIPDFSLSNHDSRPSSSGTTTYFTWSNSQDSHQARRYIDDIRPRSMEPARTATPESIQKALAATGVYNDTGICSYDVSNNQQSRSLATRSESSSTRNSMIHHEKTYEGKSSRMSPRCSNSTDATVTSPAYLEARWNTILPPEWRPRRLSKTEVSMTDQERMTTAPDITISSEHPSRHGIVEQPRAEPIRDLHPDQPACHPKEDYPGTSPHFAAESPLIIPPDIDQIINHAAPIDQDRATISSRDAMPPPPIPASRLDSLHSCILKPGDDSKSSVRPGSTRPVVTHSQVPNCGHAQTTDNNGAASQPRGSSREPENVASTPDSISWISQAMTSGMSSYEREKTFSRLSMRSPIYEIQGIGRDSERTLALTPLPATHMAESMVDFIVRIESELEESEPIEEYCQQEPISEYRQFSLEMMMRNNETQNQQLMASDGPQIDRRQLAIGVTDIGSKELVETNQRFYKYEELAAPARDHTTAMSTEYPRDDRDEFLEMSNFWRPNRFSYF